MNTRTKTKTLERLCLDGGNAFIKYQYGSTLECLPSWAVKLASYQEVAPGTIWTEYEGDRWAFGAIAQDLGGQPLFELGKATMTPIIVKALLESTGYDAVDRLGVLVPDARDTQWRENVKPTIEAAVPATNVQFISEGIPPYRWAVKNGVWKWPDSPNAILDCGGGELTLIMFTRSGVIDWDKSMKLPGTNHLAQAIANHLAPQCAYNPSPGDILRGIEEGTFEYIDSGRLHDFTAIYEVQREGWIKFIRDTIRQRWQSQGIRVGQVMMIGGGVNMLREMVGENRPYFIPSDPKCPNFHQLINAYAMPLVVGA